MHGPSDSARKSASILGLFFARQRETHERDAMISTTTAHPEGISLETLPVATACLDPAGTIVDANRRFLRLFRLVRPRFQAMTLADAVSQPHRSTVQRALLELAAVHREGAARVIRAERSMAPGMWLTMEMSRYGSAGLTGYLVCAQPMIKNRRRDVTSVEAWPTMLTALSHELHGSLNAIRGWVSMAQGGALPSERIPRVFGIIGRNADNLWRLVETLFDLSRHATGSLALKLETVDVNQLVELVAESAYPAAMQHDVTVTTNCTSTAFVVSGDRVRLEQVVRNLVDNALKFTPAGGKVTLTTACRPSVGELVVDDTGAGISSELLPAIFDPFRQGSVDVAPADVGVGLGLALVREIVQLHRGEIVASSKGAGTGSTFVVRLPLMTAAARMTDPQSVHGRMRGAPPVERRDISADRLHHEVC
jgi:signal transduction histidine kinase